MFNFKHFQVEIFNMVVFWFGAGLEFFSVHMLSWQKTGLFFPISKISKISSLYPTFSLHTEHTSYDKLEDRKEKRKGKKKSQLQTERKTKVTCSDFLKKRFIWNKRGKEFI